VKSTSKFYVLHFLEFTTSIYKLCGITIRRTIRGRMKKPGVHGGPYKRGVNFCQ